MEFAFSAEDDAFRRELTDFIRQEHSPEWDDADRGSDDASWTATKQMRQKLSSWGWRWRCTNMAFQSPVLPLPSWCRRPEPSFTTWLAAWTTPGASRRS